MEGANGEWPAIATKRLQELQEGGKKIRVYTCGSFDLLNKGTVQFLKRIKERLPSCELMVGVYSDEDINHHKGLNVLYESERIKTLQYCKYIDLIYFPAPWIHSFDFFEENEVDFVVGEINGWDHDLLVSDDQDLTDFNRSKLTTKNGLHQTLETFNNISHKALSGLGLKIYGDSKFNFLKSKVFSPAHAEQADEAEATPLHDRATFRLPYHDDLLLKGGGPLSDPHFRPLKPPGPSSKGSEGSGKKTKNGEHHSAHYRERSRCLLDELKQNGMYIPVDIENRTGASELIVRILKHRNAFYERSIKQGFSKRDLNLSYFDYLRYKFKIWIVSLCKKLA